MFFQSPNWFISCFDWKKQRQQLPFFVMLVGYLHSCYFKNHYEKKVFVSLTPALLTRISLSTLEIQSTSNKLQVAFDLVVNDNLGLMIRGGIEYGLGIFITGVDQESAAFRNGLRVSKS